MTTTTYRLTRSQPEGDCYYLPRLCAFLQVTKGTYKEDEVQRLIESEIERRGIRWNGRVGIVPSLSEPVEIEG